MNFLTEMSNREQNIWAELSINLAVTSYYFVKVYSVPGGVGIDSLEMGRIIGNMIGYAIVGSIFIFSVINWKTDEEQKDERDYQFEAKAKTVSYWALMTCLIALISFILLNGSTYPFVAFEKIEFTPLLNANVLIFSLLISSTAGALMQLYYYRRGF